MKKRIIKIINIKTNSKYLIIDNSKIAHSKVKQTKLRTHNILNTSPNLLSCLAMTTLKSRSIQYKYKKTNRLRHKKVTNKE